MLTECTPLELLPYRWCFVEAAISAGVKAGANRLDLGKRTDQAMDHAYGGLWIPEVRLDHVCAAERPPPLLPDTVKRLLEHEKVFTNKSDVGTVAELYRTFFEGVARTATGLELRELGWGAPEAVQLCEALPHFAVLTSLDLSENKLDAKAVIALVGYLRESATLHTLEYVCGTTPSPRECAQRFESYPFRLLSAAADASVDSTLDRSLADNSLGGYFDDEYEFQADSSGIEKLSQALKSNSTLQTLKYAAECLHSRLRLTVSSR